MLSSLKAPIIPYKAGHYDVQGLIFGVHVSGSSAYLANWVWGLRIVGVSVPSNPYEIGFYKTCGNDLGVSPSGFYTYFPDFIHGLNIIIR